MKIPANVSSLKTKLEGVFAKKPDEKEENPDLSRRTLSKIAEERSKRKALTDELANEKTTSERKQQIIDELQQKLEAAEAELATTKQQFEELTPKAKKWDDFEHVERTKLMEKLPPEKKKEVRDLPLNLLRTFVEGVAGKPQEQKEKGITGNDWRTLMESGDSEAFEKAVAADPKGYNAFMDNPT